MAEQEILPPKILYNSKRQTYTVRYNPFPRQQLLHSTDVTQILYGGAAGGGKQLVVENTTVITPEGSKPLAEVELGSQVVGQCGNVRTVVDDAYQDSPPCYRLYLDTGDTVDCGEGHLWAVYSPEDIKNRMRHDPEWRRKRRESRKFDNENRQRKYVPRNREYKTTDDVPIKVIPVEELYELVKESKRHYGIPVAEEYSGERRIKNPYDYGLYVGDGYDNYHAICGLKKDVDEYIEKGAQIEDFSQWPSNKEYYKEEYYNKAWFKKEVMFDGSKYEIPTWFPYADAGDKLAFIQGLMDTDGYANKSGGQCEYTTSEKDTCFMVWRVLRSLGEKVARPRQRVLGKKDTKRHWKIKWVARKPMFRLDRKLERQKLIKYTRYYFIKKIEKIDPKPCRCITVDHKDGMFLVNDFIPTHNSIAIRWDCYLFCLSNPGLRAYLFRRYRTELQRNHIDFIKDEVPESLGTYNKQNNVLEFVNGSKLYMCFCDKEDDVRLYQGAEMHLLVVDEATHLSAFQLNYLRTRVRLGSYQPVDRSYLPRIIFATNPHGGPGHHFLKSTFVDVTNIETIFHDKNTQIFERKDAHGRVVKKYFPGLSSIYIPAKMSDNYSLDDSYEAQFTGMAEELIKALKDGDWSSLVGAAIPDLSERKHRIPDILKLQKQRQFSFQHWTTFVSVDWGTASPFSIGYYVVADQWIEFKDSKTGRVVDIPEGALIRFAEIYGCLQTEENKGLRLPANAVCRKMLAFEKENNINPDYYVADTSMWAQSNGPTPEEHFRQHGVFLRQAKKDRPINYAEILARVLGNPQFKETGEKEYPMLFVTDNCHAFWRTVPPLVLDENDPDKGPATVKPKQEDHVYDELAYACRSRPFTMTLEDRHEQDLESYRDSYMRAREEAGESSVDPGYCG